MAKLLHCRDKNNEKRHIYGDVTSARVCFALGSTTDIFPSVRYVGVKSKSDVS